MLGLTHTRQLWNRCPESSPLLSAPWMGWVQPVAPQGRGPPHNACVFFQAPTVTIEGFLQALSLAVDKQFEDRKKLSSCT